MRHKLWPLMLWAVSALLVSTAAVRGESIPPQPVDGKIAWVYSYEEGKDLAAKHGKPMFVVFRCER